MRISELSQRSGVAVPTIKFYLREGLLQAGRLTSPTQAQYDDEHLGRIRLIRALLVSGLSVVDTREVLGRLVIPPENVPGLLAATQQLLMPAEEGVDLSAAEALVTRWGWQVDPSYLGPLAQLARALQAAEAAGFALLPEVLDGYARAMHEVGEVEIANIPQSSAAEAVRYVVLGTVLMEPLILALRRLAEGDAAYRRYANPGTPAAASAVEPG